MTKSLLISSTPFTNGILYHSHVFPRRTSTPGPTCEEPRAAWLQVISFSELVERPPQRRPFSFLVKMDCAQSPCATCASVICCTLLCFRE